MTLLLRMFAITALITACSVPARANVEVEAVLLLGTGLDTGSAANNPYLAQIGGAVELTLAGWVAGVRAIRAEGETIECDLLPGGSCAGTVEGVRTFGVDFGRDWELGMLHLSPRLGLGFLDEKRGERAGAYVDPGGVAELEIGWFVVGADLRYRFVIKERDTHGFLAYGRIGFRF